MVKIGGIDLLDRFDEHGSFFSLGRQLEEFSRVGGSPVAHDDDGIDVRSPAEVLELPLPLLRGLADRIKNLCPGKLAQELDGKIKKRIVVRCRLGKECDGKVRRKKITAGK